MKKLTSLLALTMILAFTGCTSNEDGQNRDTSSEKIIVGTQTGTIQELALKDFVGENKNIEIKQLSSYSSIIQDIKTGRIDVLICEEAVADDIINANPDLVVNSFDHEYKNDSLGNAIGIAKENTELLNDVNEALKSLKDEGIIDTLVEKYFKNDETEITKSVVGDNNKFTESLIVGTNSGYSPYVVVDTEGNLGGFDVDLAEYIALELGYSLEWKDVDFQGLVPSLQTNKFDFIIGGISPTDERKESINFSDNYYDTEEGLVNVIISSKSKEVNFSDLLEVLE